MLNQEPDTRNVGLLKVLRAVRVDLDIFELLAANISEISNLGAGRSFFLHVQDLVTRGITLGLCKIYEKESRFDLQSLDGVLRAAERYDANGAAADHIRELTSRVDETQEQHSEDLAQLKSYRDKVVAHAEFGYSQSHIPSLETLEKLYDVAYETYSTVAKELVGVFPVPADLDTKPRNGLIAVLKSHGISDVKRRLP